MLDRVSRYPGRVRLVKVPGSDDLYDMTLADEPTVEGTPLNKQNLLNDSTAKLFRGGLHPNVYLTQDWVPVDFIFQTIARDGFGSGSSACWFAQCDTPHGDSVKEIELPSLERAPRDGDHITVFFVQGNSATSNLKLKITYQNGKQTHTMDIKRNGYTPIMALSCNVNTCIEFVYAAYGDYRTSWREWKPIGLPSMNRAYCKNGSYEGDGTYGYDHAIDLLEGEYNNARGTLAGIKDTESTDFAILINGYAIVFADGEWSSTFDGHSRSIIGRSAAQQMNKLGHYYNYGVIYS